MGFWNRLFGKPKVAKAYYFNNGGGVFSFAYTKSVFYENGEWWVQLDDKKGQNVFNWPYSKLNADPVSNERFEEYK